MTDQQLEIIETIAYSRLINKVFTPAECIMLHQWGNGFETPKNELMQKYLAVRDKIETSKWWKPDFKYNEQHDLFYTYNLGELWIKVNNN